MNNIISMSRIIIIGAGPASYILTQKLVDHHNKVYIFDHRVPWEKPCGGILPVNVTSEFIDINDYPYPRKCYQGIHFITYDKACRFIRYNSPFYVVSRRDLSEYMREKLLNHGISVIKEKVTKILRDNNAWRVITDNKTYAADIIVGADGAPSITRQAVMGRIPPGHRYIAAGYYFNEVSEDRCMVKFSDFPGYLWSVSSPYNATAGIIVQDQAIGAKKVFSYVDNFIDEEFPSSEITGRYTAYIPSASDPEFYNQPCAGDNWILVGDAAGHVEPLVGEGIYYALKSGELAAEAIIAGDIQSYDRKWREEYGARLITNASYKKTLLNLASRFGPQMYGAFLYNNLCANFYTG
jgi:flavin-dependent dehydrogenase